MRYSNPALSIKFLISGMATDFLDLIWPASCKVCGNPLEHDRHACVCRKCWSKIIPIVPPVCAVCGKPVALENVICRICRETPPEFSLARAAGIYEGVLKEIIHLFKFKGRRWLNRHLGKLLADAVINDRKIIEGVSGIVPVPLFRKRKRERTYNQSMLLAKELKRYFDLPVLKDVLIRMRPTVSQSDLTRRERFRNVKGAFACVKPEKIEKQCILLVDDVLTTGATASECANVLRRSGAGEVRVFTVATTL